MAPSKKQIKITKQRAVFVSESGATFGIVDVPKPGPGQILVKVVAAAQNPEDCQFQFCPFSRKGYGTHWFPHFAFVVRPYLGKTVRRALKQRKYGRILGNEFAGVVEELGPDVPEGVRIVGEAVAGVIVGSQFFAFVHVPPPPHTESQIIAGQGNGAFSEYLVADAQLGVMRMLRYWSFEEASQMGVAPIAALQCLHQTLELPSPFEARSTSDPQRSILIWGGSSAVGLYAIQFAKLCGLRVLATASPNRFNLLWGIGADELFDYNDKRVVEQIRAESGNALDIAIDTISEGKTPGQVTGAIGDKGGKVAITLPYESPRPDVKVTFSMVTDLLRRVRMV
jgi:NADPH:quinone reductase-like Zn-dependent oxidoreductase